MCAEWQVPAAGKKPPKFDAYQTSEVMASHGRTSAWNVLDVDLPQRFFGRLKKRTVEDHWSLQFRLLPVQAWELVHTLTSTCRGADLVASHWEVMPCAKEWLGFCLLGVRSACWITSKPVHVNSWWRIKNSYEKKKNVDSHFSCLFWLVFLTFCFFHESFSIPFASSRSGQGAPESRWTEAGSCENGDEKPDMNGMKWHGI